MPPIFYYVVHQKQVLDDFTETEVVHKVGRPFWAVIGAISDGPEGPSYIRIGASNHIRTCETDHSGIACLPQAAESLSRSTQALSGVGQAVPDCNAEVIVSFRA